VCVNEKIANTLFVVSEGKEGSGPLLVANSITKVGEKAALNRSRDQAFSV
jgi:hypothetical protein